MGVPVLALFATCKYSNLFRTSYKLYILHLNLAVFFFV